MHKPSTHVANPDDGYELTDIQIKVILVSGVALVVLSAVAFFVSFLFAKMLIAEQRSPVTDYKAAQTTEEHNVWNSDVRLQPNTAATLNAHKTEQADADWYGIVSESPAIYRIPVEKALDHTLEYGLPVWTPEELN